ncbi:MAG: DUF4837 family protein [Fidelibacterota bacterium]
MTSLLRKVFTIVSILTGLLFLSACDIKRKAVGADDELMVIVNEDQKKDVMNLLTKIFSDTIYTPKPEPVYKTIFVNPSGFNDIKNLNNIIIASLGDDLTEPATKLIYDLLGENQFAQTLEGAHCVLFIRDLYASNQLVLILNAREKATLRAAINEKKDFIKHQFDEKMIRQQNKYLFNRMRRKKEEHLIASRYPWSIKIPWGWEVIRDSLEAQFVWIGRETPYQWVAVHSEPGIIANDSTAAADQFRIFPENYFKTIKINPYKFHGELTDFGRWSAWRYTGVWEAIEEAKGGPFLGSLFYDGMTDNTFIIFALIHFPGKRKNLYMHQLDLIAGTFRIEEK